MNENYNVPGLEKGLTLLELLAQKGAWMTLQDITSELDITTTMAFRILATLTRMDYVQYNEREKSYKASRKMLQLGYQTIGELDMKELINPTLRSIRDQVKESVFFGILGPEKGIFIEQMLGLHPFKFVVTLGSSFDLHNSAGGKAILAFSDDSLREYYLQKMEFEACTANTVTSRQEYVAQLKQVAKSGYAIDYEESLLGVVCMGAPVMNYDNKAVGAIWVSGPTSRFEGKMMEEIKTVLIQECGELSSKLGYIKK